ncbi:hypothetical protein [Singulisphaera sp. PoT]|uniref:hypothetical protein n=1 Tax=Singulisphaera sp. PoT TaxID=3411797 RepID=UPI003BF4D7C5
MTRTGLRVCALLMIFPWCGPAWTVAEEPKASQAPADFKLTMSFFGAGGKAVATEEIVIRKRLAYHFVSGESLEVIVLDPAQERLEILDLDRRLLTRITFRRLEIFQQELLKTIQATNSRRLKQGGRNNALLAGMSHDLVEPKFETSYDEATHHLRLMNPTIEVEARGEPEADHARNVYIVNALSIMAKLDSFRDPASLPASSKLTALNAIADRKLRPTEMSFLYRLAGPPRRIRWTYKLETQLSERETEALARIEAMKLKFRPVAFEEFEKHEKPE